MLTENEIKRIVRETVVETLSSLGVDTSDPFEVQKDFQHLRSWRESVESVKRTSLTAAVGALVLGVLGLIWAKVTGKL